MHLSHRTRGARAPTFTDGWARGAPWVEEQQTRNSPNCTDYHAVSLTANRCTKSVDSISQKWLYPIKNSVWHSACYFETLRQHRVPVNDVEGDRRDPDALVLYWTHIAVVYAHKPTDWLSNWLISCLFVWLIGKRHILASFQWFPVVLILPPNLIFSCQFYCHTHIRALQM